LKGRKYTGLRGIEYVGQWKKVVWELRIYKNSIMLYWQNGNRGWGREKRVLGEMSLSLNMGVGGK